MTQQTQPSTAVPVASSSTSLRQVLSSTQTPAASASIANDSDSLISIGG